MLKIGEAFKTEMLVTGNDGLPATGLTVSYVVYDESNGVFATGSASEVGTTGMYAVTWTPDVAGFWKVKMFYNDTFIFYDSKSYHVGAGIEASIETKIDIIDTIIDNLHDTDIPDLHTDIGSVLSNIAALNNITAASVWTVGTRALTDKANFTLASAEYDNIRKSVCLTGDTASSIGKILYDLFNTNIPDIHTDVADIHTDIGTIHTDIDAILADTSELQTDWVNGGRLDLLVDSIISKIDVIDPYFDVPVADATSNTIERDVVGNKTDVAQTTIGTNRSLMGYLKGVLTELQSASYGLSHIHSTLDTVSTYVDTEVATLVTNIGTPVNTGGTASIGAVLGDVANSSIVTRIAAIDSIIDNLHDTDIPDIHTDIADLHVDVGTTITGIGDVHTDVAALNTLLVSATYGLDALHTHLAAIPTTAMRGTDNAALAATALTNATWTDARAGYIDYLNNGTYGLSALNTAITAIHTHIDDIHDTDLAGVITKIGTITNTGGTASIGAIFGDFANTSLITRIADLHTDVADNHTDIADLHTHIVRVSCGPHDFWGTNNAVVTITNSAGALTLTTPSVVVADIPSGATVYRVVALLKIASIRDTSGADNAINNASMVLQVDAASNFESAITAITIPDNSWAVDVTTTAPVGAGTSRGGDVIIGSADIDSEVTGNGTYYFRFNNAQCDGNNLNLQDLLVGLRVYFII